MHVSIMMLALQTSTSLQANTILLMQDLLHVTSYSCHIVEYATISLNGVVDIRRK